MKIHVLLRHLAMAVLLLLPAFAFAQKVTVRGVVVDETGAPLSGAAVLVQGTSQGTVTKPMSMLPSESHCSTS